MQLWTMKAKLASSTSLEVESRCQTSEGQASGAQLRLPPGNTQEASGVTGLGWEGVWAFCLSSQK